MSFLIQSGANFCSAVYNTSTIALSTVAKRAVDLYPETSHGWGEAAARVGILAAGITTAAVGLNQLSDLRHSVSNAADKSSDIVRRTMKLARIGLILGVSAAEVTIAYCLPSIIRRFSGEA